MSIFNAISNITHMPQRIQSEDGFFYPEEHWNKLYRCGNDFVLVKKSVIETLPINLLEELSKVIINELSKNIETLIKTHIDNKSDIINELSEKLETFETTQTTINLMDDSLVQQGETIDNLNTIIENLTQQIEELKNIPNDVDNKLSQVYENYKTVINDIIDDKVLKFESMISSKNKNIDENNNKTLSLKDLNSLQLMFNADELCKLRDKGLI